MIYRTTVKVCASTAITASDIGKHTRSRSISIDLVIRSNVFITAHTTRTGYVNHAINAEGITKRSEVLH